jgi:hypothetical protein
MVDEVADLVGRSCGRGSAPGYMRLLVTPDLKPSAPQGHRSKIATGEWRTGQDANISFPQAAFLL